MKIGILTYHRTLNYGACLQAVATRVVLERMGHEVYYIDYWPDYHREKYQLFPKKKFRKFNILQKVKFLLKLLKHYKSQKRRIENFELFFRTYIYPYCRPVDDSYDVVVYGSDQIWRKQRELGTYNPFYFGQNDIKAGRHVSYAASMGILPNKDSEKIVVKELVSHLDKISVRENNLRQMLLSLGIENVLLSLDPTLLLSSEEWDNYLPTKAYTGEKYALIYLLNSDSFDMKAVRKFAENRRLKLIVLNGYANSRNTDKNITSASPLDFIRLIKNAEYVFSASFHGLAFAIIYGKQVFASFKSNAGRAESLLNQLGMSDRLINPKSPIPDNLPFVNYKEVRRKIVSLRCDSLCYLNEIIKLECKVDYGND